MFFLRNYRLLKSLKLCKWYSNCVIARCVLVHKNTRNEICGKYANSTKRVLFWQKGHNFILSALRMLCKFSVWGTSDRRILGTSVGEKNVLLLCVSSRWSALLSFVALKFYHIAFFVLSRVVQETSLCRMITITLFTYTTINSQYTLSLFK